jgi:hypothetical protein
LTVVDRDAGGWTCFVKRQFSARRNPVTRSEALAFASQLETIRIDVDDPARRPSAVSLHVTASLSAADYGPRVVADGNLHHRSGGSAIVSRQWRASG